MKKPKDVKEDTNELLKFNLSPNYFIEKSDYLKNLTNINNIEIKTFLKKSLIPYPITFKTKIQCEPMLKIFYENAKKNIEESTRIEILRNGLFIYNQKLLFYCLKNKQLEDNYISDINNIECIDHELYDKSEQNSIKTKSNKSDNIIYNNKNISKDILDTNETKKSFNTCNLHEAKTNQITGLKNRALGLESLVFFYF